MDNVNRKRHIRAVMLPRVQPIIPTRRKEPFDDPDWSRFDALGDQVAAVLDESAPCRVRNWRHFQQDPSLEPESKIGIL